MLGCWYEITAYSVNPGTFATIYRDINHHKQAEARAIQSEAELLAMIGNTDDIIVSRDLKGRAIVFNSAFIDIVKKLFGVEARPGIKTMDYLPEQQKLRWENIIKQVSAGNGYVEEFSWSFEEETRYYELSFNPIRVGNEITGFTEFTRDITEYKHAEEKLQFAYRQLLDIIEFLPQATFVINQDRQIIAWNRAVEEMTGVPKEEMLGKNDYAYSVPFYGKKQPILIDVFFDENFLKNEEVKQHYTFIEISTNTICAEFFVPTANQGTGGYYSGKASPLYDSNGKLVGAIESIQDITRRKRLEEELINYHHNLEDLVRERTNELSQANERLNQEIVKRKEVELSLRSSEQEKAVILDNLSEHVVYHDPKMRIKWANRSACLSLGMDQEQIKGHRCFEKIAQSSNPCPGCPVAKTLQTGQVQENEMANFRDDKVWHVRAYPVIDNHCIVGVVELAVDITRQKLTEQALKESEEKFRSMVENVSDIIYAFNTNGNISYVSPNIKDILGYEVADVINQSLLLFINAEDINVFINFINESMENSVAKGSLEVRIKHQDGSWRWHRSTLTILRDAAGGISYLGISRDVNERKDARESLKRFRTALDHSADSIFLVDYQTMLFIDVNSAACMSLGYLREELLSLKPKNINPIYTRQEIARVFSDTKQGQVIETMHRHKNGTAFPVEVLLNFVELDNKVVIVASARDITQRKQFEKEMARLERLNLVGEMAASIGHEIRNPMTTVRGFLQIHGEKEDLAKYKRYYDLMIEELDRANSIITEYLYLAKDKVQRKEMQSLSSIVESLYLLITSEGLEHEKHVSIDLQEVPDLLLDKQEMHQLILNLVRNGLDAMTMGGTVTIRTFMEQQKVVLSVQDQGHGIEPHVLEKIGTPFFTTKEHGTGLGLSVCYNIANRHNTVIDVETGSWGTKFLVRFSVPLTGSDPPVPVCQTRWLRHS